MAKILITGGAGQLGMELAALEWGPGFTVAIPGRDQLDIADGAAVDRFVGDVEPAAIINAAAYTAVDRAEDEPAQCYAVNAFGPLNLARAAATLGIPLVHVSTDYVFGPGTGSRLETDAPGPISVYGASKLAGELGVLGAHERSVIVRTAWVVSPHRANFVKTMLRLATERGEISVVADQVGCPTVARDLALAIREIALQMIGDVNAPTGIFHFANQGETTWAGFAGAVMDFAKARGLPTAVIRDIATSQFPTRAVRPADSRLNTDKIRKAYGVEPRPWREAVAETVDALATAYRLEKNS